jgi:hypothetical protein
LQPRNNKNPITLGNFLSNSSSSSLLHLFKNSSYIFDISISISKVSSLLPSTDSLIAIKMSEPTNPVEEPVVVVAPTTETPVVETVAESTPVVETAAPAETATEAPAATETALAAAEEAAAAAPVEEEAKPVEEGVLGYKAPGLIKYVLYPLNYLPAQSVHHF